MAQPITIDPALVNMNVDSLAALRSLPWQDQPQLNRSIVQQTDADAGTEQFLAALINAAYNTEYQASFVRNRFLASNATEEFYYKKISSLNNGTICVYERFHGYVTGPYQNAIIVVMRGSQTNYDWWTDFNILQEPATGASVFQQNIDSDVLELTGLFNSINIAGKQVTFCSHSLGSHRSESVIKQLIDNNQIPASTLLKQVMFNPLIWNDTNHLAVTQAVAQYVSGTAPQYQPLADTDIFVRDGDYVALMQKVDWVGYGTTYVRENVSNSTLISSTADWYSNGVLTESQNHTIANWIIGVDKYTEPIEELLPSSMDDAAGDEYTIAGNTWMITNAKQVSYNGHPHRLSLEANPNGTPHLNMFHDANTDDNQYKWTITRDLSLANAEVKTNTYQGTVTHYLSYTYTLTNAVTPPVSVVVRFIKDRGYGEATDNREYYLIESPQTGTLYQAQTGASSTTIDHDAGWPLASPGVSIGTYQGYSLTGTGIDARNRTQWFLTHFDNDRVREMNGFVAQGNDDLRRSLYPTSISPYVAPLGISNMTPYSNNYMNFATPNVLNFHSGQKFAIFNKHYKKFLKYDGNAHNWTSYASPERAGNEAILNNYTFVDAYNFAEVIGVGSNLLYKYNTHASSNNQIRLYPCDSSGIVTIAGEFIGKSWHAMNRTVFVKTTDGDNSFWWDGEFGFQSHLSHGDDHNDLMMMRAYMHNGVLKLNAQNNISGGWNGTTYNIQSTTGVPQTNMDEFKWFIYLI